MFLFSGSTSQREPENVASFINYNVTLECWIATGRDIRWAQCITDSDCAFISLGSDMVDPPEGEDDRYSRYSISTVDDVSPGNQVNLRISGVQSEDGGQYRCDDVLEAGRRFSEVIVITGTSRSTYM